MGVAAQLRRARPAAARRHLLRRRPRDDRRLGRGRLDDHRDRRGQGARRRGARRVPDPGQPAHRDPAVHRGAHRHHQLDGRRRARRSSRRCRRSSSSPPGCVLVAHNAPFDVGFLRHFAEEQGRPWPRVRGARHRPARPPGDHPRRRPQLQALLAGPGVPLRHDAQPPGARRRPRDRRRAARADGAARRPRRAHPRGAADLLLAGQPGAAPQAPPRRGAAPRPRRLPVPRRAGPGALRRHLPRPAHPGAHLLHRLGDPHPDGRDGRAGHRGDRHRVRDPARGRGARAAADRRAQAALQPPLALPREGRTSSSSPASRGRGCRWSAGRSTTAPTTSGRSPPGAPPSSAWPRCTRRSRSASAATGSASVPPQRRACSPRWAGACPRATAASTRRPTPPSCASCATACCAGPTTWSRRSTGGWRALAADERFEEAGVHRDRLAAFLRAAARTQRLTRADPAARARRRPPRGRRPLGGARRPPRPAGGGRRDPGRRRRPQYVAELRAGAETVVPSPGPGAGRDRRGDREDPALAGVARRPAGRRRRRVDLPRRRGHPPPRAPRRRQPEPRSRWCRSTSGARSRPSTNPRAESSAARDPA